MAEYSFIVGADKAFFPAVNALLNSLDYVGWKYDVNFITFRDFPMDYLEEAASVFDYRITAHLFNPGLFENVFKGNKTDYMKRYRYKIASQVVDKYDAVCFIDADLFFVRNPELFFEVASNGFMLGCAKTSKVRYGKNPSYYVDGRDVIQGQKWNDKDICCCPIFFNERFKQVFDDVFYAYAQAKKRMEASDLFAINLMILKNGAYDRLITLPCNQWVGTNETMLKPYCRVIEREGNLISEDGNPVYSVHGKWFSEGWHNGQILHMERLIEKHLGGNEKNEKHWRGQYSQSLKQIMRKFVDMTMHHKISLEDYKQHVKDEHLNFVKGYR